MQNISIVLIQCKRQDDTTRYNQADSKHHFSDIKKYSGVMECRLEDAYTLEMLIEDNKKNLELAKKYHIPYWLVDEKYDVDRCLEWIKLGQ